LRHAANRYQAALQAIEAAQAAGIHAETLRLPHRLMGEMF
jgi:hypothetical protein